MKTLVTLILGSLLTLSAQAYESCDEVVAESFDTIHKLADETLEATAAMAASQNVLKVTATKFLKNQGNGNVSVITDDQGNLAGIRVDFKLNGHKNDVMIKTFQEIDSGEKLEYLEYNAPKPALVVKKAYGAKIYPSTGGEFTFSILAKKPDSYQHHSVYLRKVNGKWLVRNKAGVNLRSVDLTPNVESLAWDGTFSAATFE
jgi:hypothetical protein